LVTGVQPDDYVHYDNRLRKPVCIKKIENGIEIGSMVVQGVDEIEYRRQRLKYFIPNNVAVLLSISEKAAYRGQELLMRFFKSDGVQLDVSKYDGNKIEFINHRSKEVCDYIENIQTSVVFAYTALEAFSNLSVPTGYEYVVEVKPKGTREVFNKEAIERWVPLRDKLTKILPGVYEARSPSTQRFWGHFVRLEKYRHDIIHQKSIDSTEFYKAYFMNDVFDVCAVAEKIIHFFYEQLSNNNRTNPLWPWMKNTTNHIPMINEYDPSWFEVLGDIHEGIGRK